MRVLCSFAVLAALLAGSCDKKSKQTAPTASQSGASPAGRSSAPTSTASATPTASSEERDEVARAVDAGGNLSELADVGPGGPISASSAGVVFITKDDRVAIAPLGKKPGSIEATKEAKDHFVIARGPSVAGEHAYWISSGRLVRRKLKGGALEELAQGARSGTRVTALPKTENRPASVAYIGPAITPDARGAAYLWVEGSEPVVVSPEGSAASSVSLAATEDTLYVATLEGRTGMTPVHVREVDVSSGKPKLAEDVVVWVGGPAQSLTEVTAVNADDGLRALIPLERDITRFGLANVQVGSEPKMSAPVVWRPYPNGLDPAPVAVSSGCGDSYVVYARPAEARPRSPQELHLARLTTAGLGPSSVVARASAFANVSAAETPQGVLVAYVADFRTWARVYSCETAKR